MEIFYLFPKYGNKFLGYLIVNKNQIEKLNLNGASPMKFNQGSSARKQKN